MTTMEQSLWRTAASPSFTVYLCSLGSKKKKKKKEKKSFHVFETMADILIYLFGK